MGIGSKINVIVMYLDTLIKNVKFGELCFPLISKCLSDMVKITLLRIALPTLDKVQLSSMQQTIVCCPL